MEWFGPSNRIEYIDQDDALLIRITALAYWIGLAVPLGCAIGTGVAAYLGAAWWVILGLFSASLYFAYRWYTPEEVELFVTGTRLQARVKTQFGTTKVERGWRQIYGIGFSHGPEENDPSGLYTEEPGGGVLLTDLVNREEAEAIVKRIYSRFYAVPTKARSGGTMLPPLRSSVITLFGGEK